MAANGSTPVPKADPEQAARLRAAFAYARLDKKQRAEVLGLSQRHVGRLEAAESEIDPRLWDKVIEATKVPAWFFENGFRAPPESEEPTIAERVEALEAQVRTLRQSAARGAPAPGGELGHRLEGGGTTGPDRREPGSDQDTGAQPGSGES